MVAEPFECGREHVRLAGDVARTSALTIGAEACGSPLRSSLQIASTSIPGNGSCRRCERLSVVTLEACRNKCDQGRHVFMPLTLAFERISDVMNRFRTAPADGDPGKQLRRKIRPNSGRDRPTSARFDRSRLSLGQIGLCVDLIWAFLAAVGSAKFGRLARIRVPSSALFRADVPPTRRQTSRPRANL